MVYLCLVGLAKTLHILNQQELIFYHISLQQAVLIKEVEGKSTVLFFNGP